MALADIRSFLEDRLSALDPSIDLDPGSPAQVQFIEPILTRLGVDPFETDVESFLTDRFSQEFPTVYAEDPSAVRDVFVKPLILFLTPFKREIQTIKRNQSLVDPSVLSDSEADALAANVFAERSTGGFSRGVARIFFPNPAGVQIELTNRFFDASGLSFFPVNPLAISAEEMVFNRSGNLFFMDVPVKAEKEGAEYNIAENTLVGVDGIYGAVKVTNVRKFEDGSPRLDTPTFIATARESLTEQSMVTRRGANARLAAQFQTELRSMQVIGAKDPEMGRDILIATSPGHSWIEGQVLLTGHVALVRAWSIDGEETDLPTKGDLLFVYIDKVTNPGLAQGSRLVQFQVEELLTSGASGSSPYQFNYLVRVSGDWPQGVSFSVANLRGGFRKSPVIRVSSLPDVGPVSLQVKDGAIHVYGHSDVYVRPVLQPTSVAVLDSVRDYQSLLERTSMTTVSGQNVVSDTFDFTTVAVPGDVLIIESGADAGNFVIARAYNGSLRLMTNLTTTDNSGSIRYRIVRRLRVDLFEPKIFKFPFAGVANNVLQTTIGDSLFRLTGVDLLNFGVEAGDTFRVLDGPNAGDFIIQSFDSTLGGSGINVDKPASATTQGVRFQVFKKLEPVLRPLVRVRQLLLLDPSQQSTGISVPPADPVAVVPTGDMTSARVRGGSSQSSGFALPDLTGYINMSNVSSHTGRYSNGMDIATNFFREFGIGNSQFDQIDVPKSAFGQCSWFVSTSEETTSSENFPPVDPRPGECLTIKTGPNKGSYLIEQVVKFKHYVGTNRVWTYFIKIYGTFPTDSLRYLIDFLDNASSDGAAGAAVSEKLNDSTVRTWPTYFSTTYADLGSRLAIALTHYGTSSPTAGELQAAIDEMVFCEYEWGDPARGVLRSFFTEPVLFEQRTAQSKTPTLYTHESANGVVSKFRPDPLRYSTYELVPAHTDTPAEPTAYPRDATGLTSVTYTSLTSAFNVGATVTGQTSRATAIIVSVSSGAMVVRDMNGRLQASEALTDDGTTPGSATCSTVTNLSEQFFHSDTSMLSAGVLEGDVLGIHEEILLAPSNYLNGSAIRTTAGSTVITVATDSSGLFSAVSEGDLLFIEEGTDAGGYQVVKKLTNSQLTLDRPLTETTPATIVESAGTAQFDGTDNILQASSAIFGSAYVGKTATFWGDDFRYQGSFVITAVVSSTVVQVDRATSGDFPTGVALNGFIVVTDSPTTAPKAVLSGTELYAVRPIRVYSHIEKTFVIDSVTATDPGVSRVHYTGTAAKAGYKQPYHIYRKDIRRITPTELDANKDGPLFYFDTEVVSVNPDATANLRNDSYLVADPATYASLGYRLFVLDNTLSYSMLEQTFLDLPTKILPVGVDDSLQNYLSLNGSAIRVDYEKADLVQQVQEFLDSPQDRVTASNMLARHLLPAYVSYDASYTGGSKTGVVAKDMISYIESLPMEEALDVSVLEEKITRHGGNPETPTKAMVVLHDWNRKVWAEFSENKVGGTETQVPYAGTPRVSCFISGPDGSGQDAVVGERISLVRG
jgi:hypothetical protein